MTVPAAARGRAAGSRARRRLALAAVASLALGALAGCAREVRTPPAAPGTGYRPPPQGRDFQAADLVKSDVDSVAEIHLRESLASARLLTEKLYRRNPRERQRGGHASPEAAVARAFDPRHGWRFRELGYARGTEALQLAFRPEFAGDRVFAFGVGLASMLMQAYGDQTEFYLLDTLDPQKLYNAARNVEIAAWKLATARDAAGALLLLSNEIGAGPPNLSFEREIGKLIAYQDSLAIVVAERTNRTIRRVVQGVATMAFLPL
ncbi:MAG: hypothetical protein M5U08_18760 [Burkholderiales bacterium]|nr:hypothetical protein [Burkholderiales bacterium]